MNPPVKDRSPLAPAPARSSPKVPQPWHWRLRQSATHFLPLMLMAFLAVGSWWLVTNSVSTDGNRSSGPPKHEPDYEMTEFTVQRYNPDGLLGLQIDGARLRHFPDTDAVEVEQPKLRGMAKATRRISTATADRAVANGAGTEVELFGDAEVIQQALADDPATHFRSEYLHAYLEEERVTSHLPVTVVKGGTQVNAGGMDYTENDGVIRFKGRARATFNQQQNGKRP